MKDVRLVKERHETSGSTSATNKDFAFVEFFSVEDATQVLEQAKYEKLRIKGSLVYLSYSKFKRHEQYVKEINFANSDNIV